MSPSLFTKVQTQKNKKQKIQTLKLSPIVNMDTRKTSAIKFAILLIFVIIASGHI